MDLKEKIIDLISKQKEGFYWDFKVKPHSNSASLLHDILCLANAMHDGDTYLMIIGLNRNTSLRKKQSDIIDFLRTKPFSNDNCPEIEIKTLIIEDKDIDVIIVKNSPTKPYYLKKDYRDLKILVKAIFIYTRIADSITPINEQVDQYYGENDLVLILYLSIDYAIVCQIRITRVGKKKLIIIIISFLNFTLSLSK